MILGIDIGKTTHVAACLIPDVPVKKMPTLAFANSASGFQQLLDWLATFAAPNSQPAVLLERTGHYHVALQTFLLERGVAVYELAPQSRLPGETKSDRADARKLAVLLYNQLETNIIELDQRKLIRRVEPTSASAAHLGELTRRRNDLITHLTQRKNQLRSVLDRVFPEFFQVFLDPAKKTSLGLLERFPSRAEIAGASLSDLTAIAPLRPGRAKLAELRELATRSIGQDSPALRLELRQLVREIHLLQEHLDELESEIAAQVERARAGQILLSIPGMGIQHAAVILAGIGDIRAFPTKASLKAFCGWAPAASQSGTTLNSSCLMRGGNRLLRKTIYLVAWNAIQRENPWRDLYERLVPLKCEYNTRTGTYLGKNKVMGRVCGQIVEMIWTLLHRDVARAAAGLPPEFYDPTRSTRSTRRSLSLNPHAPQVPHVGISTDCF